VLGSLKQLGLSPIQLVESAGFSYAMVARYALGLSSNQAAITVFASDTIYGWIALAGARHLLNGGAQVNVVLLPCIEEMRSGPGYGLLGPLLAHGANLIEWPDPLSFELVASVVERCHNVMCGTSDAEGIARWVQSLTSFMNESAVPVHVVGTPPGLDPKSGALCKDALYASSTLSLALPLNALQANTDIIGRHYLCDLSWGLNHYRRLNYLGDPLFAEQPVTRIVTTK
jgi:NAD(P)H-hydrate repair Nnr-like enzyme with NAD(P)H-hydrate epimerase domain